MKWNLASNKSEAPFSEDGVVYSLHEIWASSMTKLCYEALGPSLCNQRLWPRKVSSECEWEWRHKRLFTCFMGRLLFQLLLCAPSFPR